MRGAGLIATVISTVLPLWESKAHLFSIAKNVMSCTKAEASVHAGEFFGDKIGADTSKVSTRSIYAPCNPLGF